MHHYIIYTILMEYDSLPEKIGLEANANAELISHNQCTYFDRHLKQQKVERHIISMKKNYKGDKEINGKETVNVRHSVSSETNISSKKVISILFKGEQKLEKEKASILTKNLIFFKLFKNNKNTTSFDIVLHNIRRGKYQCNTSKQINT